MMYEMILMALNGRETDAAVLVHGLGLAGLTGAKLTLLRVVCVADDGGEGFGKQMQLEPGSSGWRRRKQAEKDLTRLEAQCQRQGVRVEMALVVGTNGEAEEILRYAAESGQDLIVMAGDVRPWYKRWLGGCTISGVVARATVPTLLVGNGPEPQREERTTPKAHPVMAVLGSASL